MRRRDLWALAGLALWLAALLAFRAGVVEPRAWGAACTAAGAPWPCIPRAGLLWLQHYGIWGGAALALGLAGFLGAPTIVLAIAFGLGGVVNYDVSFAMLGLALTAWAWISPAAKARACRP